MSVGVFFGADQADLEIKIQATHSHESVMTKDELVITKDEPELREDEQRGDDG